MLVAAAWQWELEMRDYALGTTFDLKFTTRSFSTGAPTTMAANATVVAYADNSTTEITAGITLTYTSGFDGLAGLCNVRVVATSGNGYAAGSNYALVISAGTVGGVSVIGEVVGEFSIEAQSPLRPTTAARTLDVSAGGEAGIDWANIGSPTTAQNLSSTNIDVDQVVASVSGAVGSVTAGVTVTTNNDKTGYALTAAYDFAKGTTAMTESYAANTVAPTPVQALFAIHQMLQDFSISGTTYTVYKLDHSTTAFLATLDDASTPTSLVRE